MSSDAENAAAAAARDQALCVACPVCGAPPLERCVNQFSLRPTNVTHGTRVAAWRKARDERG